MKTTATSPCCETFRAPGRVIEGLLDVPVGTDLVLDLGEGQIAVGKVRRSQDATQGVEFETPLVSDGAGGLCTRHRVSPYVLAASGMPLQALPQRAPPCRRGCGRWLAGVRARASCRWIVGGGASARRVGRIFGLTHIQADSSSAPG